MLNGMITHEFSGLVSVSLGALRALGADDVEPVDWVPGGLEAPRFFFLAMTERKMYEEAATKVSPMRVAASTVM